MKDREGRKGWKKGCNNKIIKDHGSQRIRWGEGGGGKVKEREKKEK